MDKKQKIKILLLAALPVGLGYLFLSPMVWTTVIFASLITLVPSILFYGFLFKKLHQNKILKLRYILITTIVLGYFFEDSKIEWTLNWTLCIIFYFTIVLFIVSLFPFSLHRLVKKNTFKMKYVSYLLFAIKTQISNRSKNNTKPLSIISIAYKLKNLISLYWVSFTVLLIPLYMPLDIFVYETFYTILSFVAPFTTNNIIVFFSIVYFPIILLHIYLGRKVGKFLRRKKKFLERELQELKLSITQ